MGLAEREAVIEKLLAGYRAYFDINRFDEPEHDGVPLKAECRFYVHSEKYVLVKKAKLWEADSSEFIYLFSMPELTEELFTACKDYAYREGMKLVNPKEGHMYSYITPIFVADTCTPEAKKALTGCKIYKSFLFSFHGWMEFHTGLLLPDTGEVFTNRAGKANRTFFTQVCKH